jgi:hypothetical protein
VRIVVCNFCPNTFNRPKHSHRFTCDACQKKRHYKSARAWLLSKPIDERRSYYRLQQRKEKARLLRPERRRAA